MFNFIGMAGNYSSRMVGRFDDEEAGIMVSTASVTDGEYPYETAVAHPDYNGGDMVIVAKYNTREEADQGHTEWTAAITTEPLPDKLVDCGNSGISKMCDEFGSDMEFQRKQ